MFEPDSRTQPTFLEIVGVLSSEPKNGQETTIGQQVTTVSNHRKGSNPDPGHASSDSASSCKQPPSVRSQGSKLGIWDDSVEAPPEILVMQYVGDLFTKGTDAMHKTMEEAIEKGKPEHQIRLRAECTAHVRKIETYIDRIDSRLERAS